MDAWLKVYNTHVHLNSHAVTNKHDPMETFVSSWGKGSMFTCTPHNYSNQSMVTNNILKFIYRVWGKKLSEVEWSGAEWSHGVEWNLCNKSENF